VPLCRVSLGLSSAASRLLVLEAVTMAKLGIVTDESSSMGAI
jgi:hypothetical protein